jgi:alpha/beta superfamily hydrolase
VRALVEKISKQKGVIIDVDMIEGANHFFSTHLDEAMASVASYLDRTDDGRNMPSDLQE